jgi:hypothetical protein
MRVAFLVVALLAAPALPRIAVAKGETARIEISKGRRALVTLAGPESAGQFTIWSGPGTGDPANGPGTMTVTGRDIADWPLGEVDPPRGLKVYQVRFFCAALGETEKESVPSNQCYGVRYAIDPDSGLGYIQIPAEGDREFPGNTRTIYRGVEGRWFLASERWEELVRPRLDAALAPPARETYRHERPYIYTTPSPSRTAVGAKPSIPTKPK